MHSNEMHRRKNLALLAVPRKFCLGAGSRGSSSVRPRPASDRRRIPRWLPYRRARSRAAPAPIVAAADNGAALAGSSPRRAGSRRAAGLEPPMAQQHRQRRHQPDQRQTAQRQKQQGCRITQLRERGARNHAPDIGEMRIGTNRSGQQRMPKINGARRGLFDRRRQGHIVDERALDRLDAADALPALRGGSVRCPRPPPPCASAHRSRGRRDTASERSRRTPAPEPFGQALAVQPHHLAHQVESAVLQPRDQRRQMPPVVHDVGIRQ